MLGKNIIANYFGQFYAIGMNIIMVPIYLKYLGSEAYGLVGFFALMQSWLGLLDLGLSPTLSREVARVKNFGREKMVEFEKLLHTLEVLFALVSVIIIVVIIFFSGWLSVKWLNVKTLNLDKVKYCISLMGLMIGLRWLGGLYKSGINGAEKQVWLNFANVIFDTFRFGGVFLLFNFVSTDISHFFEYQLFISFAQLVVLFVKFYKILEIKRVKFYFSVKTIKPILPFAMSIAYTGTIWIFLTQLDKLLLSHVLSLRKYGYFTLVGMISNGIMQISGPISKAILPRMTGLHTQNKYEEMIAVYRKATQLIAVIMLSIVGVILFNPYELLYLWTGNSKAALWGKNILFWYVLGNCFLGFSSFTYYLQFAYGSLKMHVKYNTMLVFISVPLIVWSAFTYGAIGVAITWFVFRFVSFLVWPPIVHHKFAPGIHKDWIVKDIMPVFLSTLFYSSLIRWLGLSFAKFDRITNFLFLMCIGFGLLTVNILVSSEGRRAVVNFFKKCKALLG